MKVMQKTKGTRKVKELNQNKQMKKMNLRFRAGKKRLAVLGMALALCCGILTGCGSSGSGANQTKDSAAAPNAAGQNNAQDNTQNNKEDGAQSNQSASGSVQAEKTLIRIGSLKGPTSMGLLSLMEANEQGKALNDYKFQMAAGADELLPLMVKGELDIVLVPANVAAVLYSKTEGGVTVIDINTLGVLYMVSGDTSIKQMSDLKGKTIYLTGKGTTPDYVLQYLLSQNGMTTADCTLEYKSEATEVAAVLAGNPSAVGLLPQPFVTAACAQNETLSIIIDMNEEWNKVQGEGGSSMVTGVTVVRNEFLQEQKEAVTLFLKEHAESAQSINDDPEAGAVLAVKAGIIAKEPIAVKAIPKCNIVCTTGAEMRQALSGYLKVIYGQSPEAVGGALPEDGFYYVP